MPTSEQPLQPAQARVYCCRVEMVVLHIAFRREAACAPTQREAGRKHREKRRRHHRDELQACAVEEKQREHGSRVRLGSDSERLCATSQCSTRARAARAG